MDDSGEKPTFKQRIVEGIHIRFPLRRDDGEEFEVSIESVVEADGVRQGRITAVDQYAMVYEEDRNVVLPEDLEVTDGEELVVDSIEDDEQKNRRIVSPKIAAIVGGATVAAGAVVATYFYSHHKNKQ